MNNMNIKLEKVRLEDRNKLERLLQLYLHDLSLYFPITFNSDICQYEYDLDKYFIDNYAYFIKSDKDNGNNNYEISEIFVLNNYKRNKIGKEVAIKVFDMYKGNWTIKAVPNSKVAESFWKMVVNDYTNNNYIEKYTGKYNRLEIYFSNGDLDD